MKSKNHDIFGAGPTSIATIVLMSAVVLWIENALGVGKIILSIYSSFITAILLISGMAVTAYSVISLPPYKRGKQLVTQGAYKHVRHPIYSSIIFLFYPAIALFLGSWLLLASTALVYLVFRISVKGEEKILLETFGDEYKGYMKKTPRFFPMVL